MVKWEKQLAEGEEWVVYVAKLGRRSFSVRLVRRDRRGLMMHTQFESTPNNVNDAARVAKQWAEEHGVRIIIDPDWNALITEEKALKGIGEL